MSKHFKQKSKTIQDMDFLCEKKVRKKIRTFIPYSVCGITDTLKKGQTKKRSQQSSFVLMKISLKKNCSWLEAVLCPQSSQENENEKNQFEDERVWHRSGNFAFFSRKKSSCNKWPKIIQKTSLKKREKKRRKKLIFTNGEFPKYHTHKKEWICQSNLRFTVPTISDRYEEEKDNKVAHTIPSYVRVCHVSP